jgi:hypothetical protein
VAFGTLIGPSAAGFAFDLNHNYTLPIVASACANGGKVSIKAQIPVGAEETIAGAFGQGVVWASGRHHECPRSEGPDRWPCSELN